MEAAQSAKPKQTTTAYVVLKERTLSVTDEQQVAGPATDPSLVTAWVETALVEAGSSQAAVRAAAKDHGDGKYVAVPHRSYTPVSVSTETTERMVIG